MLDAMHNDVIPSHALHMTGKHHEIYLSDPRRTAPEKLQTILRQPVVGAEVAVGSVLTFDERREAARQHADDLTRSLDDLGAPLE